MTDWACLHTHSFYSVLDGLSDPKDIAATCKANGLKGAALTDHGNVSGCVKFIKAMEKAKLKWILGNEFYLCEGKPSEKNKDNRSLSHLVVLAKDFNGWQSLMKATNLSHHPDNFYYKPRLNLETLAEYTSGKVITFSGHPGSDMANILFDSKKAYSAKTYEEAKGYLKDSWQSEALYLSSYYADLFGKENFYIEIQRIDQEGFPVAAVIADCLGWVAKTQKMSKVATGDAHYPTKDDVVDHRTLLCVGLKTTFQKVGEAIDSEDGVPLGGFFRSDNYHIPTLEEINELHTEDEVANATEILNRCQPYKLNTGTLLPDFVTPNGESQIDWLRKTCREGWASRGFANTNTTYVDRVKYELRVIEENNLAGYFNIVSDICKWYRSQGGLMSPGRGSVGGSLVAYLSDITELDPIQYNLIFERFYNAGRNTKDNVHLPDIDCDFEQKRRQSVIDYITEKYSRPCVGHIVTFQRMQGKGSLKDVLRVHAACSFEEMNKMTKDIPDESQIADELQTIEEEGGEPSIIRWALENRPAKFAQWCKLEDDGSLSGEFAPYFRQAIRLEGTKKGKSKHASGIIVSPKPLADICPMLYDNKTNETMVGIEFKDAEDIGFTKFDILGVNLLDKLAGALRDINAEVIA